MTLTETSLFFGNFFITQGSLWSSFGDALYRVEIVNARVYDRLTLDEKVEGMRNNRALIVIDMQRGFLEEGHPLFCGKAARRIIPPIHKLIERERREGTPIFFTADAHAPDDKEFEIYPPHCVRGSVEAEIIPELASYLDRATLIETANYSAFFNTALEQRLQQTGATHLIFCGVCTDICVMHTVADAYYRGYEIEVRKDCVTSFDEEAHAFGLRHMETVFGARITQGKTQ